MRDHRTRSSSIAGESDQEFQPTLEALLTKLLRGVVQNEISAALRELPRPQVTPPGTVASVPELLTVNAIAEEVHATLATIREWIKSGDLKACRVGPEGKARVYRVARPDLDDFMLRRRVNPVVHDLDTQADEILQTLDADDGGRK